MSHGTSARQRMLSQPLTAPLVRTVMQRIFPRKNDYIKDMALYEELLPELQRFGVFSRGDLKRLMTKYRRSLLADDRSRLTLWEQRHFSEMFGADFVRDAVRRHFWFAYPALIRNALESEFGAVAAVHQDAPDT